MRRSYWLPIYHSRKCAGVNTPAYFRGYFGCRISRSLGLTLSGENSLLVSILRFCDNLKTFHLLSLCNILPQYNILKIISDMIKYDFIFRLRRISIAKFPDLNRNFLSKLTIQKLPWLLQPLHISLIYQPIPV